MSDPLVNNTAVEDGGEPSAEEQALRFVEQAGGIEPPEDGGEAEPESRQTHAPQEPFGTPAHRMFRERSTRRTLEQRLEQTEGRYTELQKTLDKALKALPGKPAEDDPEPDPSTEASQWILWANRQTEKRIAKKLEKLDAFVDGQSERDRLTAEQATKQQDFTRQVEETRSVIRESEDQYFEAVPEAKAGYMQRLNWYRHSLYNSLRMSGYTHEDAVDGVGESLDGAVRRAIDRKLSPAAAIDGMVIGLIRSSMMLHGGGQAEVEGDEGGEAVQPAAAAAAPREVRELREAAGASVAGSLAQAPRSRNGTGVIKTRADMEAAAKKRATAKGIPLRQAVDELMQEGFSKAQGGRR